MEGAAPVRFFLVGPTAVGKTDVAIHVAGATGAEILNIDSRQVYRMLEIGTAKPSAQQRSSVPHHLIDILDPTERCSVGRFAGLMRETLQQMRSRGASGIAVGGAGLYVDACLGRLHPLPEANPALRARFELILAREGPQALHQLLRARDAQSAERLSPNDVQRMIRALEIVELTGRPVAASYQAAPIAVCDPETPVVHLTRDRTDLYRRIETRCDAMIRAGLQAEVEGLLASGLDPRAPGLKSVGYREWVRWATGEVDEATAMAAFRQNSRRYAKRQETWFRNRLPGRIELSIGPDEPPAETARRVVGAVRSSCARGSLLGGGCAPGQGAAW